MKTKEYWKKWTAAAAVRAVKTCAQTAIGMITVGAAMSDLNWAYIGSVSIVAGIYSLLTSVAGLPEVPVEEKEDESDWE